MKSPSTFTGVIAAGKFETIPLDGDEFYFITQTCPDVTVVPVLKVSPINVQNDTSVMQGQGMYIQEGFKGLRLTNETTSPISFELVVGYRSGGQFIDNTLNVVRASLTNVFQYIPPTTRVVPAVNTLAAGQILPLPGVAAGGNFQRKAVLISNPDPVEKVQLCDLSGATVICNVEPQTSIIVDVSGPVSVKNPALVAVDAAVSEIWFYT